MKQIQFKGVGVQWLLMALLLFVGSLAQAGSIQVVVRDVTNVNTPGFKWMLQEDHTFAVDPTNPATLPSEMLSMSFHTSYHPLALDADAVPLQGFSGSAAVTIDDGFGTGDAGLGNDPDGDNIRRYYLSILPADATNGDGHALSGTPIVIDSNVTGTSSKVVKVQTHPIPTSQISIYAFRDHWPTNGAPDLPEEEMQLVDDGNGNLVPAAGWPDWTKFNIFLEEPAGRYGANGGQVIKDAFDNPLGTKYLRTTGCGTDGALVLDVNGELQICEAGDGVLTPDANGYLLIKNLSPGKYGIFINPPALEPGESIGWQQTTTIEGSPVIDAWVKANEPQVFVEFGLPGPHVFMGFTRTTEDDLNASAITPPLTGTTPAATVTGTVTNMHMSRPPSTQFYSGNPFPGCWVALNDNTANILGQALYTAPCDADSNFSIPDVPAGSYSLGLWDSNLDIVFANYAFTVNADGTCNLGDPCDFGDVAVFNWFTRLLTGVFNDLDEDGFWDATEAPVGPEGGPVSLRWRDGSIYQGFGTDTEGLAPFDEEFPFFHWMVAEVGFANKKATGATWIVDNGGPIDAANPVFADFPAVEGDTMTPQLQCAEITPGGPTYSHVWNTTTGEWECEGGNVAVNANTGNAYSVTEVGPVLTLGQQGFLGQLSAIFFGKRDYVVFTDPVFAPPADPVLPMFVGENGGISGMVTYATTRAEPDPRYGAVEEWEPGIPNVQVALYADGDIDSYPLGDFPNGVGDIDWNQNGVLDADDNVADDVNGNLIPGELADVDNMPLGNFPGPEDVDDGCTQNLCAGNGVFDLRDAIAVTYTDSWDESNPTGCQGETFMYDNGTTVEPTDCYDGMRVWNQIRPAVFDGGWAFTNYDRTHIANVNPAAEAQLAAFYTAAANAITTQNTANGGSLLYEDTLLPGDYIVQTAVPHGYHILREEHKNVDFGDYYTPSTQALPHECVGEDHVVDGIVWVHSRDDGAGGRLTMSAYVDEPMNSPYRNRTRPFCDMKRVPLNAGQNAAADFQLMTEVPVVANATGVILNDLANEFNPNSPNFGEKYAPPFSPVAFYDWNGYEVNRVYADRFGRYNAVLPSTFTMDRPFPSGASPAMYQACMNDAGPIPDPANPGQMIVDPFYNPQYSQFCYAFQYMPGVATYLDTPVVPVAAFATDNALPLDCEQPTQTPMISTVTRAGLDGPFALPGDQVRISSVGLKTVANPEWDGVDLALRNTVRDYSFSPDNNTVWILPMNETDPVPVTPQSEDADLIVIVTPDVNPGPAQLLVENANGVMSPTGITLHIGLDDGTTERCVRPTEALCNVYRVSQTDPAADFSSIQDAIGTGGGTGVTPGSLILVAPGIYDELVVMYKPVKLQGWGPGETFINARQVPAEKITNERALLEALVAEGSITLTPGMDVLAGFGPLGAPLYPTEEGAGVLVAGKLSTDGVTPQFAIAGNADARIDGFTITAATSGGGIVAANYAPNLNVTNNVISTNAGYYGGGIRFGVPGVTHIVEDTNDPDYVALDPNFAIGVEVYDNLRNESANVHHNIVSVNGGQFGAGGGISISKGTDNYSITENFICGNFSSGGGAGIGHLGYSPNGYIGDNTIAFNETFDQANGTAPPGGGIWIAGNIAIQPEGNTGLNIGPGSGSVTIDSNIIRGNLAGAGDGGGIALTRTNGYDVTSGEAYAAWDSVDIVNNMIDNNVAGVAGGGLSFSDSMVSRVFHNTIANNDSAAVGSAAFALPETNVSLPGPGGIVSRVHGTDFGTLMGLVSAEFPSRATQKELFSDPEIRSSIVYQNRAFYWSNFDVAATTTIESGLLPISCATPAAPYSSLNPLVLLPECDVASYEATTAASDISWDFGVMQGRTPLDPSVGNINRLNVTVSLIEAGPSPSNGFPTVDHVYDSGDYCAAGGNTCINNTDPGFANAYFNQGKDGLVVGEFKVIQTAGAFDEGGNFLNVTFGPLSLLEHDGIYEALDTTTTLYDYHLSAGSPAINVANNTSPATTVDIDDDERPGGDGPDPSGGNDAGADEVPE